MLETILKANQRTRWAVALRMKPLAFGWVIMKAGERNQPVSTFINEYLEQAAVRELRKDAGDATD